MKHNPLKFYYLRYSIVDAQTMINTCSGIANFVFTFTCIEGDGYLQLVSNALNADGSFCSFNQILEPYRDQAFEVSRGPVTMSNNYLTKQEMQDLIGQAVNPITDFLIFSPATMDSNHIFYNISVFSSTPNGDVKDGTLSVSTTDSATNPCPPTPQI